MASFSFYFHRSQIINQKLEHNNLDQRQTIESLTNLFNQTKIVFLIFLLI
jgi:hypothetical protein